MSLQVLNALRKSRKATVALFTAVASVVVGYLTEAIPGLKPLQNTLITVFVLVGVVLIYSIAKEDAALKEAGSVAADDLEKMIVNILGSLLTVDDSEDVPEDVPEEKPVEDGTAAKG